MREKNDGRWGVAASRVSKDQERRWMRMEKGQKESKCEETKVISLTTQPRGTDV